MIYSPATIYVILLKLRVNMFNEIYGAVFNIGGYLCHQLPDRSFNYSGYQFFLCARCSGIYFLIFVSMLFSIQGNISYRVLFFSLLCSLGINFFLHGPGFFDTNFSRFILGSLIGLSCGLIIKKSVKGIFFQ